MHSTQDGLVLAGTVAGQSWNITVDTGSNISIVRPDMLNKTTRDSLEKVVRCCAQSLERWHLFTAEVNTQFVLEG